MFHVPPRQSKDANEIKDHLFANYILGCTTVMKHELKIDSFATDPKQQIYRWKLVEFIGTQINGMFHANHEHSTNIYIKLNNLFNKETVDRLGTDLSVNDHPDALDYCIYYVAKTFISVCIEKILSDKDAVFSFPLLIYYLMASNKKFEELFLGLLYMKCPYVACYYPDSEMIYGDADIDDFEMYLRCGYYSVDEYKIKGEELFMDTMASCAELYAAIIRINITEYDMLKFAWIWLDSMLVIPIKVRLSDRMIETFLLHCWTDLYKKDQDRFDNIIKQLELYSVELEKKYKEKGEVFSQSFVDLIIDIKKVIIEIESKLTKEEIHKLTIEEFVKLLEGIISDSDPF